MKKGIVIIWLFAICFAIISIFWYNAWIYSLPTPVPQNYHAVSIGNSIGIKGQYLTGVEKPLFIHFFNPDCPCSRFNITHFKSLVKDYGDKVNFEVVVLTGKNYTAKQIQNKFGLNIPVLFDSSIAAACGVYSTPQAAIINADGKLYYKGNYNSSRYCTNPKSNYAQIALENLLDNKPEKAFTGLALKAYGCQLPYCTK